MVVVVGLGGWCFFFVRYNTKLLNHARSLGSVAHTNACTVGVQPRRETLIGVHRSTMATRGGLNHTVKERQDD